MASIKLTKLGLFYEELIASALYLAYPDIRCVGNECSLKSLDVLKERLNSKRGNRTVIDVLRSEFGIVGGSRTFSAGRCGKIVFGKVLDKASDYLSEYLNYVNVEALARSLNTIRIRGGSIEHGTGPYIDCNVAPPIALVDFVEGMRVYPAEQFDEGKGFKRCVKMDCHVYAMVLAGFALTYVGRGGDEGTTRFLVLPAQPYDVLPDEHIKVVNALTGLDLSKLPEHVIYALILSSISVPRGIYKLVAIKYEGNRKRASKKVAMLFELTVDVAQYRDFVMAAYATNARGAILEIARGLERQKRGVVQRGEEERELNIGSEALRKLIVASENPQLKDRLIAEALSELYRLKADWANTLIELASWL